MDAKGDTHIIFGLGQSGLSCARYFDRIEQTYLLLDTRKNPPGEKEVEHLSHCQGVYFGEIDQSILNGCRQLVVSPGISLQTPLVKKAKAINIDVCGDVELFARACNKPIVAITGSNGKSTVTDLTDKLINASHIKSQKGGNIGLPVLDFLPQDEADIYVLELSSFQLDTTDSLAPEVAVLLNLSEDHLDRYSGFEQYCRSKQKIYQRAKYRVFNFDDELTYPQKVCKNDLAFSLVNSVDNQSLSLSYLDTKSAGDDLLSYGLVVNHVDIMSSNLLSITGKHNFANVLACLNILTCLNIEINQDILKVLQEYKGLKHRFQLVKRDSQCQWINDSKATNVGATIAALNSLDLEPEAQLILIAGGDSKQSELSSLIQPLEDKVSALVLLGKDAELFAKLSSKLAFYRVENMRQAVCKAKQLVDGKGVVLLSPACSSLDMYKNFEARGDAFISEVRACA